MGRPELPVDWRSEPIARFAVGLRELRERAGRPGYRELARRAHFSPTTLAQAARGRSLPSLPVALAYVRACGGDTAEWELRWRTTAAQLNAHQVSAPADDPEVTGCAPYVGLASYGPEDAERFRGRDQLVATLTQRVTAQRFVAVVGASGSGKSSLLRAGLLPAMCADSERWSTLAITPGSRPLSECAVGLGTRLGLSAERLAASFRADPRNLGLAVRQLMADRPDGAELLLIVDQLEEVFTLCQDTHEREQFVAALLDTAHDPDCRARVVVGLRADFYAHCARHARLAAALQDAQVLVTPMTTDELVQAITEPAARAGLMVERALVSTVVQEAAERPGALPFVSHAMWETWRRRRGNGLFLASYQAAGGVRGAIAQTADHVYENLDEQRQRMAKAILLRLTALGDGTEDTRRRIARTELGDDPAVAEILDQLATARLVTVTEDTVEIAHEALIRSWPTLRTWLAEDREVVLTHRRLTEAAAEWERHGRDASLLYRGASLATWQDLPPDQLNDTEREFLAASRHAAAQSHRRRRRRMRLTIGGLSGATAVVTVLALVALAMAGRAEQDRTLAVGRQLIADARAQLQVDPKLALLLAREAYTRAPDADSEAVLRQAMVESHLRATLPWQPSGPAELTPVIDVMFTSDGKHLAATGSRGTLQVWDWDTDHVAQTEPQVYKSSFDGAYDLELSPDGHHIVSVGEFGVSVSDLSTGEAPRPLSEITARMEIAFSPDGRYFAGAGDDGIIRIWSTTGNDEPKLLVGDNGPILGVAFSTDGQQIVSVGLDGSVHLWDVADSRRPMLLGQGESPIHYVAFSAAGTIATASRDGVVQVWDPAGGTAPRVLGTHGGGAGDIAFNADGRRVATAGIDGTVRIWSVDHPAEPVVLRGHRDAVSKVTFSPDDESVVSASLDGTTKVWAIDEVEDVTVLRGHRGGVLTAASTPDFRRVASGGEDGTVRLWDISGRSEPAVLATLDSRITQVTFSPDGRYLAAVSEAGAALAWNLNRLTTPTRLAAPDGGVTQVGFSPDSKRLAAANFQDSLWAWNTSPVGHTDQLTADPLRNSPGTRLVAVAWSPDGHHVAATTTGSYVLIWDLSTRTKPRMLRADKASAGGRILPSSTEGTLRYSGDGTRLAATADDGTVRIWNVTNPVAPPPSSSTATRTPPCTWPSAPTGTMWRPAEETARCASGRRTAPTPP